MPWSLQYRAEHMQNSKLFALQSSLLLWISVGTKGDAWEEDRVDVGRLVRFWKSPAWQLGMFGIYTYIIYIHIYIYNILLLPLLNLLLFPRLGSEGSGYRSVR
jgi:hypothetical protein